MAVLPHLVVGCARDLVRPSDVPLVPAPRPPAGKLVLVLDAAPSPMVEEIRTATAAFQDVREMAPPPDGRIATLCSARGATVLRFRLGRVHFDTDNGDRMALLIYQSARVVLLPVAAASAWLWRWHGHTTAEAIAERVRCGVDTDATELAASVRIVSEGRGIVRGRTIEEAQAEVAVRAVTRKLLGAALDREHTAAGTIVVKEFSIEGAVIDYPELPPFGLEFSEALAAELQRLGHAAEAVPGTAPIPEGAIVVTGRITLVDRGSRAKRLLFRFGPGSAKFAIAGETTGPDGTRLGTFEHEERLARGVFGGGSGVLVERALHQTATAVAPMVAGGQRAK